MTYDYQCAAGAEFEVEQKMSDPKLTECPLCGNCTPKRLISAESGGFRLVSGASGGWASSGYSKPEGHRQAEQMLGRKLHQPIG